MEVIHVQSGLLQSDFRKLQPCSVFSCFPYNSVFSASTVSSVRDFKNFKIDDMNNMILMLFYMSACVPVCVHASVCLYV